MMAGVSPETIKAYELGSRRPTRTYLVAILNALKVERFTRNDILTAAGFAPDGLELGSAHLPHYMYTLAEIVEHVERMPWPAFVLNEMTEVVCCNRLTERLWDIDLEREFPNPIDRNMLSVASLPRFAARVENWDDVMKVGLAVFKGHHRGPESLDQASPYFSQVIQRFMKGAPEYVGRIMHLWQETEARQPKIRWEYEVRWNEPGIGRMGFLSVVNTANEPDGLAFNDWIPLDAQTWEGLEKLRKR